MRYHVSAQGSDTNDGASSFTPFATISKAAALAEPGDEIIVHDGVYRESVDPQRGGVSDLERITYRAAEGEHPVIKGSERIDTWVPEGSGVWKVRIDNDFFGDFNPFNEEVFGDWLIVPKRDEPSKHLGDIYLNGMSFYEVDSVEQVYAPDERATVRDYVTDKDTAVLNVGQTVYVWHAQVDESATTIWANFHDANPNEELTEINVRRTCFFPSRCHVNYITVQGFEMCQAATPWAPPTAPQYGIIGANWSRGWIIERNRFHDAKCSAVSIGKEASTGDNEWAKTERKNGYQYQLEAVFKGLRAGWSRGSVGGHTVRYNEIYDCGQNAIVGHMGCAFSDVSYNHIYRIGIKREFFGWEIAGIKFHAAIDTLISHNYVHDCSLGAWMDWQAQGTRISSNVFCHNNRDLMIEVSHGPCVVDNNVLASPYAFENFAQGTAFINNLICGKINLLTVLDRSTPYHFPHTTEVAGAAFVFGGDDRFTNNLFIGGDAIDEPAKSGLGAYFGYPRNMQEYVQSVHDEIANGVQGGGDPRPIQPVYAWNNVYMNDAVPAQQEVRPVTDNSDPCVRLEETPEGVVLHLNVSAILANTSVPVVATPDLGVLRIVEALYDNPDGGQLHIDVDINGDSRSASDNSVGPLASLKEGVQSALIWRSIS